MKNTLALVLMVFGIVGCSKSDTNLICDCYKETEFLSEQSKLVERECSDGIFGLSRDSLVFNEKNHSINWRDIKHTGPEKTQIGTRYTELKFEDNEIIFSDLTKQPDYSDNGILKTLVGMDFTFNRLSLVAQQRYYGNRMTSSTRYYQCKLAEGV